MLYIISGASRSGKTLIATKLLAKKGLTYLSLDWLVMGFTNGIPEYGIHDKMMPNEIAERAWPFLKAMMESMVYVGTDCIIEGEALLPELMATFQKQYPNELKICFMGYTTIPVQEKVKELKAFRQAENDWLLENSEDYIADHVQNMIGFSKRIEKSCREHSIPYIDTSLDFNKAVDDTILYLLG